MRSRDRDRAGRKLRALRRMASSSLNEARKLLLATVIDRYLPLNPAEQATFEQSLQQEQGRGISETMSIYTMLRDEARQEGIEQGIVRGIEQGMEQGRLRGEREALLRQMRAKFGEIPSDIVARIEEISDPERINALLLRVLTAATVDEMGIGQ